MFRSALASSVLATLLGCGRTATTPPESSAEAAAALSGWHYRVTVDAALEHADVRVCFDGAPPSALIPGVPEAARFLDGAATPAGHKIKRKAGVLPLSDLGDESCVDYGLDLAQLVERSGGRRALRLGDSLAMRTSQWLWRPAELPRGADVTVRFDLPAGVRASVPWPVIEPGPTPSYRLDKSAFRWLGYTVLGRVDEDHFVRAGAELSVVTLDAPIGPTPTEVRTWLADAADSVALLFGGTFPRKRLQVVVVPVEGGGGTVYFGMASRGGGSAIYILLDDGADGTELPGGWTTVHEMLHHGMPFISDAWMGEGWVSYYTEVMRTRMGHRDEVEGWNKLDEAFDRGRRGGRDDLPLGETSARMHETHAYQRVYWGGAAIAFILDVELRTRTAGDKSLDDAMVHLRQCCGDADHQWTAQQLLEELDTWFGAPLFSEIASRSLASGDFPPVDEAFAKLGVEFGSAGVVLDDTHENAAIRRAIMAPQRTP
jgi:hypothetical protein